MPHSIGCGRAEGKSRPAQKLETRSPGSKRQVRVISSRPNSARSPVKGAKGAARRTMRRAALSRDRKSTRLNSSHVKISYAVFCLKKKNAKHGRLSEKDRA